MSNYNEKAKNIDLNPPTKHCLNFEYILDTMSNNYGLAGIFANRGFGTTTLMMQIIDEINKRKDGIAIVMSNELFKEDWINEMKRMNLSTERVVVYDKAYVTHSDIFNALSVNRGNEKVSMVCVDYIDLMQKESICELREIADRFKVLILVNGKLTRDSGDYDPEHRPDMYTISAFRNHMHGNGNQVFDYKFLALLHRKHKCERGIGTADRYDIHNETELIVKRNWDCNLGSSFIKWDNNKHMFRF